MRVAYAEFLGQAAAVCAVKPGRVGLVHHQPGAVSFLEPHDGAWGPAPVAGGCLCRPRVRVGGRTRPAGACAARGYDSAGARIRRHPYCARWHPGRRRLGRQGRVRRAPPGPPAAPPGPPAAPPGPVYARYSSSGGTFRRPPLRRDRRRRVAAWCEKAMPTRTRMTKFGDAHAEGRHVAELLADLALDREARQRRTEEAQLDRTAPAARARPAAARRRCPPRHDRPRGRRWSRHRRVARPTRGAARSVWSSCCQPLARSPFVSGTTQ